MMLDKIHLLVTFALLSHAVQSLVRAETIAALADIGSGVPEVECNFVQEIVDGAYANKSDNFNDVLQFAEYSRNLNFKADVLIALYNTMSDAFHTEDPLRAIPLYNEIESLINSNSSNLHSFQLYQLEVIRYNLFLKIQDNGAGILEGAVYLNKCNHENSTVGHFLDLLNASNETLSDATISQMVHKVHWVVPVEGLFQILANFSTHMNQNVEAMLAFYNVVQMQGDFQLSFFMQLNKLQQNPDYNSTVSAEKQHRVYTIMPIPVPALLGGAVCFNQNMASGLTYYMQPSRLNTYKACLYVNSVPYYQALFNVQLNQTTNAFTFTSSYFVNRSLVIRFGYSQQVEGYTLNVYSSNLSYEDNNWKIKLDGNQVILQNMNSTRVLCAGNELARYGEEWYAYTRDATNFTLYSNECKWSVDNCKGLR